MEIKNTTEMRPDRTIDTLDNGLAYYNDQGNHFRVFLSQEDAIKWTEERDDNLVLFDTDSEDMLDEFLSNTESFVSDGGKIKDDEAYIIRGRESSISPVCTGKELKEYVDGMYQQYGIDTPKNDFETINWLISNGFVMLDSPLPSEKEFLEDHYSFDEVDNILKSSPVERLKKYVAATDDTLNIEGFMSRIANHIDSREAMLSSCEFYSLPYKLVSDLAKDEVFLQKTQKDNTITSTLEENSVSSNVNPLKKP